MNCRAKLFIISECTNRPFMTLQFKNASETELMNRRKKSVFVKLNDNQEVIEEKCYIPHN